MFLLIILAFLFLQLFFINGGGDSIKLIYPIYILDESKSPPFISEAYCSLNKNIIAREIRNYLQLIMVVSKNRFNFLISNFFGNVLTAVDFLDNHQFIGDVVLLDPSLGVLANIIAEIYKVNVFFFSPKKTIKLHKRVKHIKRLPTLSDCVKMRHKHLISFSIFLDTKDLNLQTAHELRIRARSFNKILLDNIMPTSYLILYKSEITDTHMFINTTAQIIKPPFYFPDASPYFMLQKYSEAAGRTDAFTKINLLDISVDIFIFNMCERNRIKNGENYDTHFLNRVVSRHKILEKYLGKMPKLKKNKPLYQILVNGKNSEQISFSERKKIQKSVFSEFIHKVKLIPNFPILLPPLNDFYIFKGDKINYIFEPRMRFLQFVFRKIRETSRISFYNNFEYMREFLLFGRHVYYPTIPPRIKAFSIFLTPFEILPYEDLIPTGHLIVTTNFEEILEPMKAIFKARLKFLKKISVLYIDNHNTIRRALAEAFPNLKIKIVDPETTIIPKDGWYFKFA